MFRSSKSIGKEDNTTIVKNDLKRYKAVDIAIDGSYDDLMSQRGGLLNAYSVENIDTLTKQGIYTASIDTFDGVSVVLVLNSKDGTSPVQVLYNGDKQCIRTKTENGWSSWNEVINNSSKQTISGEKTFSNDVTVTGDVYCNATVLTSDKRLKNNIISYSINNLSELKCYKYILETDGKEHIGLIAQDVKNVIPEAVHEHSNGYLAIDYSAITACLCGYINQLEKRIEYLESKVG